MRIDKLKRHGVVAGVPEIVLLSVKTGRVAEVTRKTHPIRSVGLDLEYQALPQKSLAEILRPISGEWVTGDLRASASRPHSDLVGMAFACSRDRQLFPVTRKFGANRRHQSSILLLRDLGLLLVDPAQPDLIECWIAWDGRVVSILFRREFEVSFARHDEMHSIVKRCDGELVCRIQGGLRRDERPGANARIRGSRIRESRLNGGKQQSEQYEFTNVPS